MTYQHEDNARDDDWSIVRELRQLVPALRDALAAALTRADEWRDEYQTARKGLDLYREKNVQIIQERDAAVTRAELAECHAEAMEAERDKANAEWAEAQSAATYNAEYVDLALEMRARVDALEAENARLRDGLQRIVEASEVFAQPVVSELSCRYAHETTRRLARAALTGEDAT